MGYVLLNKNTKVFVKYYTNIRFNHYVPDVAEATRFTYQQASQHRKKFKHPENWVIKRIGGKYGNRKKSR